MMGVLKKKKQMNNYNLALAQQMWHRHRIILAFTNVHKGSNQNTTNNQILKDKGTIKRAIHTTAVSNGKPRLSSRCPDDGGGPTGGC